MSHDSSSPVDPVVNVPARRVGSRLDRFACVAILVLLGFLTACGGSSADCTRVCTEARQACTDKSIDSCVSRCQSSGANAQSMHCGGHATCCGGLCCLGFYYSAYEQNNLCGSSSIYSCY